MGFLNLLYAQQAFPMLGGGVAPSSFGAQASTPPPRARRPRPLAPQPVQMPLLTAAPNGQPMAPDPFGGIPQSPALMNNLKPETPEATPGGFWSRVGKGFDMQGLNKGFDGAFNSPLFTLGMSLMGNAQGSRWDQVGADMRQYGQDQTARQRAANEERRLKSQEGRDEAVWGRQQTEWDRQDSQHAAFERLIANLSPQERERALANRQAFMEAQAQASAPITPYQQAQLDLERRSLASQDAARRSQLAYQQSQDQWMRRFQGALGAADASSVAEQGALVRQGYTQVRPILQEMRSIIERYPDIMGSWINTQDRTQMSRLAGGDPERLAAMERFQGLATQLTLPQLEALRPATNLDFERVRATVADPQMSQRGALAYLDSQLQALDRARQVSESQGQWISQYGSLSLPNQEGQTWASSVERAPFMQFAPTSESIAGGQSWPAAPAGAIARLRGNPTARERQLFDQTFGPGAAERALGGNANRGDRTGVYRNSSGMPSR